MTLGWRRKKYITWIAVGSVALATLASSVAVAFSIDSVGDVIDDIESTVDRVEGSIKSDIDSLLKSTIEDLLGLNCPGIIFIVAPTECPNSSGSVSTSTTPSSQDPDSPDDSNSSSGGSDSSDGANQPASQPETTRLASAPTKDMLTANPYVRERDLANLDDQEYTRENAAPYLGDAGRKQVEKGTGETAELIKNNLQSAQEIQKLAADAQKKTVTQEVMKSHAEVFAQLGDMAANSSRLEGQVYLGVLSLQQQQAALMQLSANVSEAADESNRRERLNQDVSAIEAMRGNIYLPFQAAQD